MSSDSKGQQGPLDSLFISTSMVVLVLFAICCGQIALVMSAVCMFTAKDPVAKSKATTTLIIAVGLHAVAFVGYFSLMILGALGGK